MADITTSEIQTFTAAEMLKAINSAIVQSSLGGESVSINGRSWKFPPIDKLMATRKVLTQQINEENGDDISLARFGNTA